MTTRTLLSLVASLLAAACLADDAATRPPSARAQDESAALQGEWRQVEQWWAGRDPDRNPPEATMVIRGNLLRLRLGGGWDTPYRIELRQSPRGIDYYQGPGDHSACRALYAVEGDRLRLCLSLDGQWPAELKPVARACYVETYQRVKR